MLNQQVNEPSSTSKRSSSQTNSSITFAEFFAGIGLVRLGLEQVGWYCNFANDIDQKKEQTYSDNFGDDHFVLDDIWNIDTRSIPTADLFTASFPCVDLSVAGHRRGIKGEESGTYWAFIKILKQLQKVKRLPKIVMLENVFGFLTSNAGQDVRYAINSLNVLGYSTDLFLLDAKHFTPQSRPRVFVIGVPSNLSRKLMAKFSAKECLGDWDTRLCGCSDELRPKKVVEVIQKNPSLDWGLLDLPSLPKRNISLNSIIEELPEDHPRWWMGEKMEKLISQIKDDHLRVLNHHLNSDTYFYGTIYRRIRKGGTRAELRSDGLAGCLRTPRGGSSKQIVARSGRGTIRARWMTPREYARLQGVPDDFHLPDSDVQAYFGLGDAVCVPAIKWIGENVLEPALKEILITK